MSIEQLLVNLKQKSGKVAMFHQGLLGTKNVFQLLRKLYKLLFNSAFSTIHRYTL